MQKITPFSGIQTKPKTAPPSTRLTIWREAPNRL